METRIANNRPECKNRREFPRRTEKTWKLKISSKNGTANVSPMEKQNKDKAMITAKAISESLNETCPFNMFPTIVLMPCRPSHKLQ